MAHRSVAAHRELTLLSKGGKRRSLSIEIALPILIGELEWQCTTTLEFMGTRVASTAVGMSGVQVLMMGLERSYFFLFFLRRRFGSRFLEHDEPYEDLIRMSPHDHIFELLSRGKGNEIWEAIKRKALASDLHSSKS